MTSDQTSTNPFASPSTVGESIKVVPGSYEIQGERILGTDKIILPHACVKCGEVLPEHDGSTRRKKDLYWVHPAIFFLVIQMLIFLIVYLVTRRKCRVEYSICRDCNAKQRINIVYCLISLGVFIGMIALMVNLENSWLALGVVFSFVAMVTFAIRANGPLTVKAYKKGEFQLRGASPAFLQFAENCTDTQAIPAVVVAEDGRLV
ncbi:hypothetical protein C5Y96_16745 [Blastopirellula marina]|uniref:Uncharacterized protein n=1 Tax=Blastopirellula marina TaxID=124 RepID=A0A2S8F794_9BACT|nr:MULTISPECIES: hypothetical protein [Pirellulaceae]PQO28023.1 hypothetical protein C5Y96_16745 [Blastopirellula marina]RCS48448.1 hypothetical protein DTL36_16765 [Bremerella cremea]